MCVQGPRATLHGLMSTRDHSRACPLCGETRIHHERQYVINGRTIRIAFSDCLHSFEEIEAHERGRKSNSAGPSSGLQHDRPVSSPTPRR
jgi:hypothetical protein